MLGLSVQAYDRILKVSRTQADMEGKDEIESRHVSEAIQYRTHYAPNNVAKRPLRGVIQKGAGSL